MLRGFSQRRLQRTVSQFGQLRLGVSGLIGLLLLTIGVAADPLSGVGVVFVSLGTGALASTVVAAIALEREDFAQTVLGLGIQEVFHDRALTFDNAFWNSLIETAKRRFAVLGCANHGYLRNQVIREDTERAVVDAVRRDVEVEILWLDPESHLAHLREESEGSRRTRDETVESIEFFWAIRERLNDPERSRLRLAEHEAMPTCGITWSDDLIIVSHYLAQELNLESPGLVLGPSLSLTDRLVERVRRSSMSLPKITEAYVANYRQIASSARPLTAERVDHLHTRIGTWGPESAARKGEGELRRERGIHDPQETT